MIRAGGQIPVENTFTEPGIYPDSAQYTDVNGCVFSAEFDTIVVEGSEELDIEFFVSGGCEPFEVELSATNSAGNCTWTFEDGSIIGNGCSITYLYNDVDDFTVEVTSNAQCPSIGSANVPIEVAEQGEFTINGNLGFCEGDSSVISALPNTNTYIWNENFSGNEFTVFEAGIYQLQILEPNGCDYIETFSVETSDGPEFIPPSSVRGCIGENLDFSEFTSSRDNLLLYHLRYA